MSSVFTKSKTKVKLDHMNNLRIHKVFTMVERFSSSMRTRKNEARKRWMFKTLQEILILSSVR